MQSKKFTCKVNGQQIIDAVQRLSNKPQIGSKAIIEPDNGDAFKVGQFSAFMHEHFIICANGQYAIDPTKTYTEITVESHQWEKVVGIIHNINSTDDDSKKAVNEFAIKLEEALS